MFHIKNIWDKLYFHPLFYFIVVVSFLTGHFRNIFYFTSIILIHELGHTITGILLGMQLNRIEIYPYGGCSKLEYPINIKLIKELLVVLMGPITQLIFIYLISILKIDVEPYLYTYSKLILIFNLLPIYPLDGGKIINIILSFFLSFYNSLRLTYYFSYLIFCIIFMFSLLYSRNLIIWFIILSLFIELYKELKKIYSYYFKFLLERHLTNINFNKIKRIKNIKEMKRDYYHYFITNNILVEEKVYLEKYFK